MSERRILKRPLYSPSASKEETSPKAEMTLEMAEKEIQKLKRQVHILKDSNLHLIQKVESQTQELSSLRQLRKEVREMKNRLGFVLSMIQFIREGKYSSMCSSFLVPCVHSSFLKNVIEIISNEHADMKEIQISFTLAPIEESLRLFDHFCIYMNYCLNAAMNCGPDCLPSFYEFELINMSMVSSDEIILSFIKGNEYIPLRIFYTKIEEGHHSSETLTLSHIGITTCRDDVDVLESLRGLFEKQFRVCVPICALQSSAFPYHAIPFDQKTNYLKQMYNAIGPRFLSKLESNYTPYGLIPSCRVERIQDCEITGQTPPYLVYMLECGHEISHLVYEGIITNSNDYTEAIRCPFCRSDLKIEVRSVPPTKMYKCISVDKCGNK